MSYRLDSNNIDTYSFYEDYSWEFKNLISPERQFDTAINIL
jgi:hypothetical protein